MKKFTLFLVAAVMSVASFAQVAGVKLNAKTMSEMQTVTPDATKLTAEQKKAVVKKLEGKALMPHVKPVPQTKSMTVKHQLDNANNASVRKAPEGVTVVTPPATLQTTVHNAKVMSLGTQQGQYTYGNSTYPVSIGFDGEDAYVQGLFYFAPKAWIKGKHNADGSITFASNQYLGTVQEYDAYVVACSDQDKQGNIEFFDSFTFTYNADKDTYYYNKVNTNLSFSTEPNTVDALDVIYNVELAGPDAPVINTNVIYEQPEGELKTYARMGDAYYVFWGYLLHSSQSGNIMRVVVNGNDVYMENPISQGLVEGGSWIKGTIEGNKIHMPLRQCVLYSEEDEFGYMTGIFKQDMVYDEYAEEYTSNYVLTNDREITFTIDDAAGTITMDLQSKIDPETELADYVYGLAYTFDDEWAQVADCNSVYTILTDTPTTMPEGAQTEQWALLYSDGEYNSVTMTDVAIVGDKMYIGGLSEQDPESVFVGTIADGKVTFKSDQYMGMGTGYLAYLTFVTYTIKQSYDPYYDEYFNEYVYKFTPEYTFNYDAENKILTPSTDDIVMLLNAGKGADDVLYINRYFAPEFCAYEEVAVKPANPIVNELAEYYEDYGYDIFSGDVLLKDINGKYIDKDKVFYILWVKTGGEAVPFKFTSAEYYGLVDALDVEEIVEVPYSAVVYDDCDYEDISEGASNICIYQSGFDDYGLQTIYYGGGVRNESDVVWLSGDVTAIRDINAKHVHNNVIYNLAGQRVVKTQKGLYIINGKKVVK